MCRIPIEQFNWRRRLHRRMELVRRTQWADHAVALGSRSCRDRASSTEAISTSGENRRALRAPSLNTRDSGPDAHFT